MTWTAKLSREKIADHVCECGYKINIVGSGDIVRARDFSDEVASYDCYIRNSGYRFEFQNRIAL